MTHWFLNTCRIHRWRGKAFPLASTARPCAFSAHPLLRRCCCHRQRAHPATPRNSSPSPVPLPALCLRAGRGVGCLLVTLALTSSVAGETLTAAQAVEIGLANNFNIRIARNDAAKADNTRKLKVGSLLPTATASGSATYSNTDYASSSSSSSYGSSSSGETWIYTAGANLGWTLFDGFKMFYGYRQVEERARLAEEASRHAIESSVVGVLTAYYNLVSARSLLDAARSQLGASVEQEKRTRSQYDYGRATKRDLLTQEVLVNADSSAVEARKLDVVRALHALNVALGRNPDEALEVVADTTVDQPRHDRSFWYGKAREHNAGLNMADIQKNIAASQLGIVRASFWPVLSASGAYTASWSDNDYTRSTAGLTLSWPIFSGLTRLTNVQNAKLDKDNAELSYSQTDRELQALVYQQWETLNNACRQVGFERTAVARAEQSLAMSEEEYKLGRITDIQYRDAQLSLLNARVRLESAIFQSKVAALQIEQLAGVLNVK